MFHAANNEVTFFFLSSFFFFFFFFVWCFSGEPIDYKYPIQAGSFFLLLLSNTHKDCAKIIIKRVVPNSPPLAVVFLFNTVVTILVQIKKLTGTWLRGRAAPTCISREGGKKAKGKPKPRNTSPSSHCKEYSLCVCLLALLTD